MCPPVLNQIHIITNSEEVFPLILLFSFPILFPCDVSCFYGRKLDESEGILNNVLCLQFITLI